MTQDVFAVLADPTRRAILDALRDGERPVGDLVDSVGASQPTVSKHLRILREADLVTQRAEGQKRFYSLHLDGLGEVTRWLSRFQVAALTAPVTAGAAAPSEDLLRDRPTLAPAVATAGPDGNSELPGTYTDGVVRRAGAGDDESSHGAGRTPAALDPRAVPQTGRPNTRGGLLASVFRRRRR